MSSTPPRFRAPRPGKTAAVSGAGSRLRDRIRQAIQEPVDRSEKLLDELQGGDDHTKLSILISGWGRGLAAGLEELAAAIEELEREPPTLDHAPPRPEPEAEPAPQRDAGESDERHADLADADEEQLLDEAKRSREKTAEAREELESSRE